MRIIVAVTGATGVQMSEILLRALRYQDNCEIHLIVSEGARLTWNLECDREITKLYSLADYVYREEDLAAIIASGSFVTDGMIILPCSMKTLSGIVSGYAENLIQRAADVCLKEGRKVVLVPREMPLGKVHLKNLKKAAAIGCAIVPPMLTFYNGAKTLEEQVDHVIGKVLLQFQLEYEKFVPWRGTSEPGVPTNDVENRCGEKQETDTLIKIDKKLSCGTLCIQAQQIGDDLQSMQALVGGYIQAVYPYEEPVALICCESGKLDGLPLNRALRDSDGDIYDIVAGNFFIVGLGESDFTDLPHELAERFAEQFRQPEMFMRVDDKIVAAPMPDEQVQGGMSY